MKIFLPILFLFPILLFGQDRTIDSLKLALKNAKHDTTRCNILNALIETESDNTIWLTYNEQLQKICEKCVAPNSQVTPSLKAFYLYYLAGSISNSGYIAQTQSDNDKALECYKRSLKIYQEIKDKKGIALSLNNIGAIFENQGDISKALEYFLNGLKIQQEIKDKKGIAYSLINIGGIYNNQGDIPKALEYFHKSLKAQEEIGDKMGTSISLNNIGAIYNNQEDPTKALEYFNKGLKIEKEIQDSLGISSSLNNIGAIYERQGNLSKALECYNLSLKIKEGTMDKNGTANTLNNIGVIYDRQNNVQKALECFQKSLKIKEEIMDKQGIANCLGYASQILLKLGKRQEALAYAQRCYKIAKELGYPENIKRAAGILKNIYKQQNNFKVAFEMYELEIKMRDSINNQKTQKASIKKQMQYKYEKQAALDSTAHAKENDIKNAEITARKAELKVKQNTQYALYGGLALVIVFAGFMFNRFKVTQKQKRIIEIKEQETQQQKHLIEEKHKEITDSINYAERIQRSFIATKEILDENLSPSLSKGEGAEQDYFVLFKPKDVVSGDFYWASFAKATAANGQRDLFYLATADSTGHGVPGAIMSLLNITSLEKAIETLTEPSEILNSTRKTIIERLKKDGSEHGGKDGMDVSLCVFDFKNKKLIIAAANNPVWIVRPVTSSSEAYREVNRENGSRYENSKGAEFSPRTDKKVEVIEIKPDKMPVGKHDRDNVSFTQQEIDLQTGDVVYTLTDGFPDQFGGEKGKKFMSKNLRELLKANSHLPMQEQKLILEKTFADWVGNLEQVDDVTIIGVKI